MAKRKHECAYCGELFVTITEHMSHVTEKHDTGFRPKGSRLPRPVSCWRCAKDMPRGVFKCECGFELPTNWVNGQLVLDDAPNDAA